MPTVDLTTLPANAQQELLDFYEFLQKKYAVAEPDLEFTCMTSHPSSISKPLLGIANGKHCLALRLSGFLYKSC